MSLAADLLEALTGEESRETVLDRMHDPEYQLLVAQAMCREELDELIGLIQADVKANERRQISRVHEFRAVRLLERVARRVELGFGRAEAEKCMYRNPGCSCMQSAVDSPEAGRLGRAGVRALARRRHVGARPEVERRRRLRRPVVVVRPRVALGHRSPARVEPRSEPGQVPVEKGAEPASFSVEVAEVVEAQVRRPRRVSRPVAEASLKRFAGLAGVEVYDPVLAAERAGFPTNRR